MKRSLTTLAVAAALAIGTAGAAAAAALPLENGGPVADTNTGSSFTGSAQGIGLLVINCLLPSLSGSAPNSIPPGTPGSCNWF
ncbi:hypothetical protein JMUB6875_32250 [Nocardia sp. JMUB6875]|uniref:hypothetical protein n=1 Tax=Nocardia sp. JMUB6875 TaxID=3158170 RepID=UPI0032E59D9B